MPSKEEIIEIARKHGCDVYIDKNGWCGCPDNRHGCDQQSSLIAFHTAKRVRLRLVKC